MRTDIEYEMVLSYIMLARPIAMPKIVLCYALFKLANRSNIQFQCFQTSYIFDKYRYIVYHSICPNCSSF